MTQSSSGLDTEVAIERDIAVEMRDGVVLRADVYRPALPGPLPVLLLRIPYDKRVAQSYCYQTPLWYARRAYIVVIQDTRGRFASAGEFWPLTHEARDGADTIEWCRNLPGGNGLVGTFGFSYAGANQLLAAAERPAGLAACCPGFYLTSMYEGFGYVGGAFALSTMAQWYALIAGDRAARLGSPEDHALVAQADALAGRWSARHAIRSIPLIAPNPVTPFAEALLQRAAPEPGTQEPDLETAELNTDVACLHVGGWYDPFIGQTLGTYARMSRAGKAEQRLLIGPWQHIPWSPQVGQFDYGPEAASTIIDDWHIAFFDAHLKKDRTSLARHAPVSVFVLGSCRWSHHASWPPHGANDSVFYLQSDGRANTAYGDGRLAPEPPPEEQPRDYFIYNPHNPVPSVGGRSTGGPGTPTGPFDQSLVEGRNDVLCYTSAVFTQAVEIAGPVVLELYAATSAVDTDFKAKLCLVNTDGRSFNLCEGIVRGRFAFDRRTEKLLEPGQSYRFELDLGSVCAEIRAGERLRLQVTSSDYPAFDRNPNSGVPLGTEDAGAMPPAMQTIFHDASRPSALRLLTRKPGDTAGGSVS
jgi:hypothetical protein